MIVLALNRGSSSLKFALFDERLLLARGAMEGIGGDCGRLWLHDADGATVTDRQGVFGAALPAVEGLFAMLAEQGLPAPGAVGHRLVHGGPHHCLPSIATGALLKSLRTDVAFAPLHLPAALDLVEAVVGRSPHLPQVLCFDTAFHHDLPDVARLFPLPRAFADVGLRRYGFHGLSFEFVVDSVGPKVLGRAVIAHLGNGASMAAVADGRAIDTTMGLTPAGGFMMGTRSGDLDPGLLLYLLRTGWDVTALDRLVNHQAGLLGASGISSDMQVLVSMRAAEPRAAFAVGMFCYQARKAIGGQAAVLGGIDSLVFTGGIGERSVEVREEICAGLGHLGVELDPARNKAGSGVISRADSRVTVRVVHTDEESVIARHTRRVLEAT